MSEAPCLSKLAETHDIDERCYSLDVRCSNCGSRQKIFVPLGQLFENARPRRKCQRCKCADVLYQMFIED